MWNYWRRIGRMALARFALIGYRAADNRGAGKQCILSAGAFARELVRARAYADRSGKGFVLVSFTPEKAALATGGRAVMAALADAVAERTRTSDVAGWHGRPDTAGVVLFGAGRKQAAGLVRAIEDAFRQRLGRRACCCGLRCDVLPYKPRESSVAAGSARGDA